MSEYNNGGGAGGLEQMCTCESTGREADMERCCIAHRPASVRRVLTRVETPRNTERQGRTGGGGSNEQQGEQIEKNTLMQTKSSVKTKACLRLTQTTTNSPYSFTPSTIQEGAPRAPSLVSAR